MLCGKCGRTESLRGVEAIRGLFEDYYGAFAELEEGWPVALRGEVRGSATDIDDAQRRLSEIVSGLRLRPAPAGRLGCERGARRPDRKSTRLNSSHVRISYAV